MERGREKARAQETAPLRAHVALALTGIAIVGLAVLGFASQADAARDPSASAFLEGAVKPQMQTTLRKSVPGIAVTRVTCFVPTTSKVITGPCTVKFKVAKYGLLGTYKLKATLANGGKLTIGTTYFLRCTDLRGRRASCDGRSNSGNGLISAPLAETQLLRQGFTLKGATKKVQSATCTGSKAQRWVHGKFDDVFSRLKCVVKATDGSYSLVFQMAGAGYNLSAVKKR
jgi:hypothetical protein